MTRVKCLRVTRSGGSTERAVPPDAAVQLTTLLLFCLYQHYYNANIQRMSINTHTQSRLSLCFNFPPKVVIMQP